MHTHGHSFFDMVANAFLHSAVYRMVGAAVKGQSLGTVIGICLVILAVVLAYKTYQR